jgi:hypothetical protein
LCQGTAQYYSQLTQPTSFDTTIFKSEKDIAEKGYKTDKNGRVLAGIKDIDICFFFRKHPNVIIPDKRNCRKSIRVSLKGFGERDIDFMKKAIKSSLKDSQKQRTAIRSYLRNANTTSSKHWSESSVIGLYPNNLLGKLIWKVQWLVKD